MLVLKDKQNKKAFNHTHQQKRKKINKQTNKQTIRNERREITTDTTEIRKIVRNYYKQLYGKKFENLGEMDKFLEKYNLPKLNQRSRKPEQTNNN